MPDTALACHFEEEEEEETILHPGNDFFFRIEIQPFKCCTFSQVCTLSSQLPIHKKSFDLAKHSKVLSITLQKRLCAPA
jgi:hypothetical protein